VTGYAIRVASWRETRGACRLHHRRRCAAIPGVVGPSPALWHSAMMRHHHVGACAPKSSSLGKTLEQAWAHPRTGVRTATEHEHRSRPHSKPSLDKHRSHHAAHKSRDSPSHHEFAKGQESTGTTVTPRTLYTSTLSLCITPYNTFVSGLPLAYKRRRQPPRRPRTPSHNTAYPRY
jgi:hypothetical protein